MGPLHPADQHEREGGKRYQYGVDGIGDIGSPKHATSFTPQVGQVKDSFVRERLRRHYKGGVAALCPERECCITRL